MTKSGSSAFFLPLPSSGRRNGTRELFKYETNPVSRLYNEGVPILPHFSCVSVPTLRKGNEWEGPVHGEAGETIFLKDQVSYI